MCWLQGKGWCMASVQSGFEEAKKARLVASVGRVTSMGNDGNLNCQ